MKEVVTTATSTKTNMSSRSAQKKQNKLGPYTLLQTLGEGEFGKVKLGVHSETNEEVAIKLIRKDGVGSDSRINKVEREIAILKNLNHPYIVKLYNVIETEKYVGLVLEYASGGELFEYILAHRYLKERDAKRFFAQLISSVQYMHKCKIVHRDLKLENILIDKNRNIIVTDFGFANQFSTAADDMMSTTCGSPCYAAPELVVNAGLYAGSAVDIWSCGVILFAMLSGFLPFDDDPSNPDSDDINQLYRYIISTRLIFPPHISPDARDLMEKMLVPDPSKRCTLDMVIKHPWLEEYRGFLIYDISMDSVPSDNLKQSVSALSTNIHQMRKNPLSTNRDRFAPVANNEFLAKHSIERVAKESIRDDNNRHSLIVTTPPILEKGPVRHNSTRSSKIPSFITRKPVKEIMRPPSTIPEAVMGTVQPEKSLSTPTSQLDSSKLLGNIRINQHKDRLLGFFTKTPNASKGTEEADHLETSIVGNSSSSLVIKESTAPKSIFMRLAEDNSQPSSMSESGVTLSTHSSVSFKDPSSRLAINIAQQQQQPKRTSMIRQEYTCTSLPCSNDTSSVASSAGNSPIPDVTYSTVRRRVGDKAMEAVRRSIYRRTRSPSPTAPNQENVMQSLALIGKSPEQPKPQRNTWSNTVDMQQMQPKKAGKKMIDWIKKRSHKHPETSGYRKEVVPTNATVLKGFVQPEASIATPQPTASTSTRGRTLSSNALALAKEEPTGDSRIQIHQGPIDRTALTSRPPQQVIQEARRILRILGIETISDDEDGPFVLKCTRRKASKRKEEIGRLQPIYGEACIDSGEEIRFIVEICRFKNLPGLFIVNVKRLKGNVWAYKFLYHKLIDFLDLGKEDYMQAKKP